MTEQSLFVSPAEAISARGFRPMMGKDPRPDEEFRAERARIIGFETARNGRSILL